MKHNEPVEDITFNLHKFTDQTRPDPKDVVIFPMFSEFGSEMVGVLYCIPQLIREKYPGKYVIIMGWYGRPYLYKHLADEFWEVQPQHQWMRTHCLAFHHNSSNLKRTERRAKKHGYVVGMDELGAVFGFLPIRECMIPTCKGEVRSDIVTGCQICMKCGHKYPKPGLTQNIYKAKQSAVWVPDPSAEKVEHVRKFLKPRSVGVTARNRTTYGRNLPPIYYERLLCMLADMGYNPVWIGERATSLDCPCPWVTNFSVAEESADLEMTLALTKQLDFTVQFWTASTRLAGLVGTPFILFESPDQIWGQGQEGYRMNLCSKGPHKLVIAHFNRVKEDQTTALDLVHRAVRDVECGDYRDIVGMVENPAHVGQMRLQNVTRVGGTYV